MKNIFLIIMITAGLNAFAQHNTSIDDFKSATGKWLGTLTYLDYTSGKPYSLPCNITFAGNSSNAQQLILSYEYPNEPKANGIDTIEISNDGSMIDDEKLISREFKNNMLKIITEKNGVDGNDHKKAILRFTFEISNSLFIKRKEVLFEGEAKWVLRHEYKMSR